ncbi:flagellar filament capping protein FliD [Pseudomonas sp. NyZ704]|nr:flagellar filament capping protein FliD [Pseudomonas sp. NyZ704]
MAIQGLGNGIGSGLDINGIVKALVDAESAPKSAQLNRLERSTTEKFSGLGQFRGALAEFQTALKGLNDPALFEKRSATSGKPDIFSVTADGKASAGNFNVQVFNLAQTSKVALAGVADPTAGMGTGTLTIDVGDTQLNIDITEGKDSLGAIRDAINAAGKESGLTASIVTDPSGAGGSRLVLSSNQSGTGNDISVSVVSDDGASALSGLAYTPAAPDADFTPTPVDPGNPMAARTISYGQDAQLAIDGIKISSATNTIGDAIEGVSITLKSKQSQEDIDNNTSVSLAVAEDRAGVKSQLKNFVEAYNKMMGTVASLTKVTKVGGDDGEPLAAVLVGDSSVRSFMSAIRNELGNAQGSDGMRILADLGISTQSDGKLAIDDARLDTVLQDNFEQLNGFLTGDSGLLARLDNKVDPYTQTGGILESRTTALQNTLSNVDGQREQLARRIDKLEARLFSQFNAMDALVAQLSGTSDYLTGALDNLPGVVRQDRR